MTIQNIFALPNEVFVTLFASITVALITAFQILALMRGKGPAASGEATSPSLAVLVQVFYGLLVFAGFAWWTINLSTIGLFNWALVSVCFALVGLVMPIILWQQATKKATDSSVATSAHESESSLLVDDKDSGWAPALVSLATLSESIDEISEADALRPALATTESATLCAPQVAISAAPASAEALALPTDSILKRHYQQLLATKHALSEPTRVLAGHPEQASPSPVLVKKNSNTHAVVALPQDSVLRRHALGILHAQIVANLPDRPSDSVLKRHYSQLLASALANSHSCKTPFGF